MTKKELKDLIDLEYDRLNIQTGRYTPKAPPHMRKIRSNQVKALINVFADILEVE